MPFHNQNYSLPTGIDAISPAQYRLPDATILTRILEAEGDALVIIDATWRYVYINDNAEPILTKRREELLGRTIFDVFPEVEETLFWEVYQRAVREQIPLTVEDYFQPLETWFNVRAFPHEGFLYLHFRDITESKKTEQERRLLEEKSIRAARALDSVNDAFVTLDRNWRITYLNAQAARINKKNAESFIGRIHWEEWPASVGTSFETEFRRAMNERVPVQFENRYYVPDRYDVWLSVSAYPANEEDGGGLHIVYHDITERKQAEAALQNAQAELALRAHNHAALVESATDSLVRYDRNLRFVFVNPAFERYTGLAAKQVIGKNLREVGFPEETVSEWEATYQRVFESGEPMRTEVTLDRLEGDGKRTFERSITPEFDSESPGDVKTILTFSRDITERKQLERREHFLTDLTEQIRASLNPEEVLYEATRLVAQFTGSNRCLYAEINEATEILTVHRDFVQGDGVASIQGTYPLYSFGPPIVESLRAGNVTICEDTETDSRLEPQYRETFRALNFQSFLCVPLHKEGKWVAILVLHNATSRRWTPAEAELLTTVAERTWLAVENARLFRELRQRAEREALLSEASTLLSSSLEYQETLSVIANLIVPRFADWCSVDLTDDNGTPRQVHVAHVDPAKVEWGRQLQERYIPDPNAPRGLAAVLRTGKAEFVSVVTDEMVVAVARDPEHLRLLREVGLTSVMIVPLVVGGRVFGALSFVGTHESGRQFDEEDLRLAEELGRRAALAIENARLFRTTQEAEAKQRRIAETLQRSMLLAPPQDAFPGIQVGTHYEAAWDEAQIGGDFFETVPLDFGRVGLIVGDSTGKGLEAARFVSELQFLLRNFLREDSDPANALLRLNKSLIDSQRLDNRPETALAAVAIAVIDTGTGETWVASGGAEPPLLLHAETQSTEEIAVTGPLLGADAFAVYEPVCRVLNSGDLLVLVTDGITEARNRKTRRFFGYLGFQETVQNLVDPADVGSSTSNSALNTMASAIVTQAKVFTGGKLSDDACVLIARRTPESL